MRVSYPVAGKNWGWVSIPRIGQEVLVSFLEGNPDRPLVVGGVYNANQMPPYDLPANQTQSGMKSRSTKQGVTENFNEIRFEDKKDSEEVYIHAEKDFNCVIENNETRKIGLDKKDKGNQTVEIQNDRSVKLNEGNDTLQIKMGNREETIDKGNDKLKISQGNRETTLGQGNDSKNVKMGNHSINVGMGKSTIEAMTSIELKVGGNSIKIDQSGITIKGLMVKIQADAMLEAKSPMTTVKGDGMLILKGGLTMIN
jgi:type VI secretion system secreted protein VgrG